MPKRTDHTANAGAHGRLLSQVDNGPTSYETGDPRALLICGKLLVSQLRYRLNAFISQRRKKRQ